MLRIFLALWFAIMPAFAWAGSMTLMGVGTAGPAVVPMKTPILAMSAPTGTISTTVADYNNLIVGTPNNTWTSTNANRELPVAIPGTFSNLVVNFPVAVGVGTSYTVALTKNGANTVLLCQVTSAALNCTDTTDTVTVVAGDTLGWSTCPGPITAGTCVPGTAPNAQGTVQVGALFTSANTNESFIVGTSTGNMTPPINMGFSGSGAVSSTESVVSSVMPTAGTIDQLYVDTQVAPGAAASISYTINQNGSPTGVTCTIGPSTSAKTCSDLTHSITVAAGDTISVGNAVASGAPSGPAIVRIGARWKPTIPGEALLLSVSSSTFPAVAAASQTVVSGGSLNSGETNAFTIIPIAATVKKLFVNLSTAPGGSITRIVTLRHGTGGGQSNALVTCTVGSASTSCSDTTDSYSASLNDFINMQETVVGGSAAALSSFKTSLVITSP